MRADLNGSNVRTVVAFDTDRIEAPEFVKFDPEDGKKKIHVLKLHLLLLKDNIVDLFRIKKKQLIFSFCYSLNSVPHNSVG